LYKTYDNRTFFGIHNAQFIIYSHFANMASMAIHFFDFLKVSIVNFRITRVAIMVLVQFSWATSDLWLIQQNKFYWKATDLWWPS